MIGIARFKQRRKDAVRKMDDTEQNLTRVRDIIAEIESQLDPLKASADKTTRYNRLYAQYVQCKTTLYINRYDTAQSQLAALAANEKKAVDAAIAAMTQTSVAESERELIGAELANADEQLLYYDRILAASSLTLQKTDGQIQVGRERLEHIGQRREKLINESTTLTDRLEFLDGSLSDCREKLAGLQAVAANAQGIGVVPGHLTVLVCLAGVRGKALAHVGRWQRLRRYVRRYLRGEADRHCVFSHAAPVPRRSSE